MKHQLPLHRIQQKFWTDCLLKDNDIDYNDPNTTFVVEGELDLTTLKEAYRLIMKEYPDKFSEKEVDKLAFENARYMISVLFLTIL